MLLEWNDDLFEWLSSKKKWNILLRQLKEEYWEGIVFKLRAKNKAPRQIKSILEIGKSYEKSIQR
jgi:predicted alpha/beta-fold hydrolase